MKKRRTNVQKVRDIIKVMDQNIMAQLVVMTALDNYLEQITSQDKEPKGWPGLIHWPSWRESAVQLKNVLAEAV